MRMMLRLSLGLALAALTSGSAYAVPVTFTFDSVSVVGSQPVTTTLIGAPVAGSGDLAFDSSGNLSSGSLSIASFSLSIDITAIPGEDAQITTTSWLQNLAAGTNVAGSIILAGGTAGGSNVCTATGALGSLVCPSVVGTVAPFGVGGTSTQTNTTTMTLTSFVSPTQFAGTITSVTNDTANGGSTTTLGYSFASVPEPSTALLLGAGLLGLGALGRRRV